MIKNIVIKPLNEGIMVLIEKEYNEGFYIDISIDEIYNNMHNVINKICIEKNK